MMIYSLCLLLILVGLYGVVVSRETLKIVISILIMNHGVHLLLLLIGYREAGNPPIVDPGASIASFANGAVDPLPQAMVLTSIVIGLGVLALMVALCVRLYERYGTFDITEIRRLRG
ncbi:MAG: cation:proton antiporter [Xanthomonadales bacterium]|nr:sodium:proton antiporter [Gammaproteobacteria bacterium]NNK03580.1 cation:proton antiporter [Xanthomonadales bacterium]NNK97486.1 cation:proton antiporter [Xanthomonadales bacterium]